MHIYMYIRDRNKIKRKTKEQTQRRKPENAKEKIKKIEAIIRGWVNYFSIAVSYTHLDVYKRQEI